MEDDASEDHQVEHMKMELNGEDEEADAKLEPLRLETSPSSVKSGTSDTSDLSYNRTVRYHCLKTLS